MNSKLKNNVLRVAIVLSLGSFAVTGFGGTNTADLAVTAEITSTCEVSTTAVVFGTYDPFSGTPNDATGTVTLQCTVGSLPKITLNEGLLPNTSSFPGTPLREMSDGPNKLAYNLYSDAGHTTVWEGTTGIAGTTPTGSAIAQDIFGRIAAGQNAVPNGTYADTVTVNIIY